ncbi:Glycosyltransferase involved in cell wall bisynthesis [Flavobacterium flevense]|uniref:Glycosyl transferase n=1 Tax=Flavobacterium flevense TaxID=983 RepID=A0A4Y4AY57_9FLAO|nr:glycosyltransferase [Flavobacterium flevense]GEC73205.1 glycosyl transferase [Flavobacterium flevense]SHL99486.1 Glycosyltransferase involved in cell wall bisynthesis [Flavobacterium flevense]
MNNQYLFTIVIPTHNRADDLKRCLVSLEKQTYKNFEVLVCDDGSTDHTKDIVEDFKDILNLKYFYNENTGGPAGPRNVGIENSQANWICFLDSDDWYSENRLEFISKLDLEEFDFLYHDLNVIQNGNIIRRNTSRNLNTTNPYRDLLCNLNAIPTSSTCVRKSFLVEAKGFSTNKDIVGLEDFHLWIRIAKSNARFKYIPEVLGFYFIGGDNLTLHDQRQINRFRALYTEFINQDVNRSFKNKISAALNYQTGWILVNNSQAKEAFSFLFRSLIFGSFAIKMRSLNMLRKGIKF